MSRVKFNAIRENGYYVIEGIEPLLDSVKSLYESGGSESIIVVPGSIGGIPVKRVRSLGLTSLRTNLLYFEDGIEVIEDESCNTIQAKNIRLPDTLIELGNYAIFSEFENVVLPPSLKIIGEAPIQFVRNLYNFSDSNITSKFYASIHKNISNERIYITNLGKGRVIWNPDEHNLHRDFYNERIHYSLVIRSREKSRNVLHQSVNNIECNVEFEELEETREFSGVIYKSLSDSNLMKGFQFNENSNQLLRLFDNGIEKWEEEISIKENISLIFSNLKTLEEREQREREDRNLRYQLQLEQLKKEEREQQQKLEQEKPTEVPLENEGQSEKEETKKEGKTNEVDIEDFSIFSVFSKVKELFTKKEK